MKKSITLITLLFTFAFALAQEDAKPTKEETMEFIKAESKKLFYNNTYTADGFYSEALTSTKEILFTDCEMKIILEKKSISYSNDGDKSNSHEETIVIPINKIESIERSSSDKFNILSFDAYKKEQSITYIGQTNSGSVETKMESQYNLILSNSFSQLEKLTKAFNHLRKLCGAPDPISFD